MLRTLGVQHWGLVYSRPFWQTPLRGAMSAGTARTLAMREARTMSCILTGWKVFREEEIIKN